MSQNKNSGTQRGNQQQTNTLQGQESGELDQARPDAVAVREEEQLPRNILLAQQLLEEANQTNRAQPFESPKHKNALRRLVAAFRHLCSLRGEEFERAFVLFQEAAREREGVFHPVLRNAALAMANPGAEREALTIFLNMVVRYARARPEQKSNFAANNNVDRLLAVIQDEELRSLMAQAFGAS